MSIGQLPDIPPPIDGPLPEGMPRRGFSKGASIKVYGDDTRKTRRTARRVGLSVTQSLIDPEYMKAVRVRNAKKKVGMQVPSQEDVDVLREAGLRVIRRANNTYGITRASEPSGTEVILDEDEAEDLNVPERDPEEKLADLPDDIDDGFEEVTEIQDSRAVAVSPAAPAETPMDLWRRVTGRWGLAWARWETETLEREAAATFGTALRSLDLERIQAMSALLQGDAFWNDWQTFEKVVVALSGRVADFDESQILSVAEIAGIAQFADFVQKDQEYGESVRNYVGAVAHHEGLVILPPILQWAAGALAALTGETPLLNEVRRLMMTEDPITETPAGIQVARLRAIEQAAQEISGVR